MIPGHGVCVCLEPTEDDGFLLASYQSAESDMPALFPLIVLEMNKCTGKRLKTDLEDRCEHVEEIRTMVNYKT